MGVCGSHAVGDSGEYELLKGLGVFVLCCVAKSYLES